MDSTLNRNAVLNAINNSMRKKGKRFIKLWKSKGKTVDKEQYKLQKADILRATKKESNWIDKIYKANGFKRKQKNKQETSKKSSERKRN